MGNKRIEVLYDLSDLKSEEDIRDLRSIVIEHLTRYLIA
jgi:hypothetical protein